MRERDESAGSRDRIGPGNESLDRSEPTRVHLDRAQCLVSISRDEPRQSFLLETNFSIVRSVRYYNLFIIIHVCGDFQSSRSVNNSLINLVSVTDIDRNCSWL